MFLFATRKQSITVVEFKYFNCDNLDCPSYEVAGGDNLQRRGRCQKQDSRRKATHNSCSNLIHIIIFVKQCCNIINRNGVS